jgi:hypothetical protein
MMFLTHKFKIKKKSVFSKVNFLQILMAREFGHVKKKPRLFVKNNPGMVGEKVEFGDILRGCKMENEVNYPSHKYTGYTGNEKCLYCLFHVQTFDQRIQRAH